uniref:Uncharacterized protein n=1 Tax=Anguilla anguilla TaxID=7936 RepID=A0A0E9XPZ3_ANGAN
MCSYCVGQLSFSVARQSDRPRSSVHL